MAAKEVRIVVTLACQECKQRNYTTTKNRQHNPDRLALQKFCRWCGKHTEHREAK